MKEEGTCPVMQSTWEQVPMAVQRAALAFSTPGPGTTEQAAGRPVDFAAPKAM